MVFVEYLSIIGQTVMKFSTDLWCMMRMNPNDWNFYFSCYVVLIVSSITDMQMYPVNI